VLSVLINTDV